MKTLSLVKILSQRHRYSGTDGEKTTQEFIVNQLKKLGYTPKKEVFKYIGSEKYLKFSKLFFSLTLLALIILSGFLHPLISSSLFIIYAIFKSKIYPKIELKIAKDKSFNIIATKNPNKKNHLIICGHYDSAKVASVNILKHSKILLNFSYLTILFTAIYFSLLFLFGVYLISKQEMDIYFGLVNSFGAIWFVVPAFIFLIYVAFTLSNFETKNFSKGADDNASGVAVMLKVAEYIKERNLNLRIDFLFLGAEEQGFFGSKYFVDKYKKLLDKENTYIINLDCVGRGKLFLFPLGFGTFFKRKISQFIYNIVIEVCKKNNYHFITDWMPYSDGASFLKENFRVFTISRCDVEVASIFERAIKKLFLIPVNSNFIPSQEWIHSENDTVELIDEKKLEETRSLLIEIIKNLSKE